ncbi:hypothetical protein E4T42_02974 [Aureobasidium subglaciale]|nr:hypothetical protein E4T42_02974 [Aureobasidium subglaciale]
MELRRRRAATPQKPSRLQPTEALHMTTRAASKAASSNGGSSRRGSLYSNGQISPMTGNDNEPDRYPKRRRVSTASKSTPTAAIYNSQSSSSRPSTRSMSGGNLQPIAESSPMPRRKRKRTSDVTAENISVAQPIKTRSEFELALLSPATKKQPPRKAKRFSNSSRGQETAEEEDEDDEDEDEEPAESDIDAAEDDPKDTVEVFEDLHPTANGHEEASLNEKSNGITDVTADDCDEDDSMHDAGAPAGVDQEMANQQQTQSTDSKDVAEQASDMQSLEIAPNGSLYSQDGDQQAGQDGDDAEGEYDEDGDLDLSRDELTLPKQLGITTLDPTPVVSATASPVGSNQDSNAEQESPTKHSALIPAGDALTASQNGDKPVKKLPGRRRAPHANPKVEAALRRQLHLRMAYRSVAKNLKPILTELAKRSLSSIHRDPEAHTAFSEYPIVKQTLEGHFQERLDWIQKQKILNKKRLDDMLEEQTAMRKRNFEHVAQNIEDDMIVQLQHDFLNKLRQQRQAEDDDYSDDEGDDVIPSLRRVTAKGTLRGILGPEYHWRSRPALETERLFNEMHERRQIASEHIKHDKSSALEDPRPFTTFDPVVRDAAEAQLKMRELLAALGVAAEEVARPPPVPIVEAPPAVPVIPNNEALGLLMLAEASATPIFAAPAQSENISMDPPTDVPSRQDNLSVPRPSMSRAGSVATPAPPSNLPAKPMEEPSSEQRHATTVPISFSQAVLEPSTTQTAPLFTRHLQPEQPEQRAQSRLPNLPSIGQVVASQSHADTLPQPVATSAPSKAVDFWSSLSIDHTKSSSQGKAEFVPHTVARQSSVAEPPVGGGADNSKSEDREPRPSLPGSSTTLEPLHEKLRRTSDSFGPLLNRLDDLDNPKPRKMPAPKKSLYGPWPRSRNYNPLDRRVSTTSTAPSQPSLPGIHSRPSSGLEATTPYSTSETRRPSYVAAPPPPVPGFPTSLAQSGPYNPAPIYGSAPPHPFAYERGPYPPMTYAPPPPGFAGLAGGPMQPGQAPPPFYGGPHGLPPPNQQQGGYGPPPISSRPPPTAPAYGPQYGGQPILPAGHDPRFGPTGAPASNNAGPAFAQFAQHDGRRRRNQSLGNREFQHYQPR